MYAIRNKQSGKWLVGTDRERKRQITSWAWALTFESEEEAKMVMLRRHCGKGYEIVKVKLEVVE